MLDKSLYKCYNLLKYFNDDPLTSMEKMFYMCSLSDMKKMEWRKKNKKIYFLKIK